MSRSIPAQEKPEQTELEQKSVIVSFPEMTPQSVVDECKNQIIKEGGVIVHQYQIIKGFFAIVSSPMLDAIGKLDDVWKANIEDVHDVTASSQMSSGVRI
ncbi:hypothetical protein K3495_g4370 [Podosphaera aphanis]|nr:hypothetical protein K3495_g4370 [Podosphaera aphanis]